MLLQAGLGGKNQIAKGCWLGRKWAHFSRQWPPPRQQWIKCKIKLTMEIVIQHVSLSLVPFHIVCSFRVTYSKFHIVVKVYLRDTGCAYLIWSSHCSPQEGYRPLCLWCLWCPLGLPWEHWKGFSPKLRLRKVCVLALSTVLPCDPREATANLEWYKEINYHRSSASWCIRWPSNVSHGCDSCTVLDHF